MVRKNVVLELKLGERVSSASGSSYQERRQAVREAKVAAADALSHLSCWDPALEVGGLNTMFPVLVVTGPAPAIDDLSDHVLNDLPDLVSAIEQDMHFSGH
jgi:hypothetical protein